MTGDGVSYRLAGPVTFDTLGRLREEGEAAIADSGDPIVIDLAPLEQANSAAVALLMAWWRFADAHGKRIVFRAPPPSLSNIIALSGMTEVLPLEQDATASAARARTQEVGE